MLGDIVATRKLFVDGEPGRVVLVYLGRPQPSPGVDAEWYCPYQIAGLDDDNLYAICGIDAFQAIELAVKMIATKLVTFNRKHGHNLRWEAGEKGDLGFPIPNWEGFRE